MPGNTRKYTATGVSPDFNKPRIAAHRNRNFLLNYESGTRSPKQNYVSPTETFTSREPAPTPSPPPRSPIPLGLNYSQRGRARERMNSNGSSPTDDGWRRNRGSGGEKSREGLINCTEEEEEEGGRMTCGKSRGPLVSPGSSLNFRGV